MGPQSWTTVVPECQFLGENGNDPSGAPTLKCLEAVFANVLSVVVSLAGVALFVMLTIGAFKYLTSGGDPKQAESAQKTMTTAVLGLVIIIGSYLILRLISNFTGVDLLKFEIPQF